MESKKLLNRQDTWLIGFAFWTESRDIYLGAFKNHRSKGQPNEIFRLQIQTNLDHLVTG